MIARAALALAAFSLLAPARGLAADVKLRGIAIDQRLDAEPLPADLPHVVPTIVRLLIDGTAVTGPAADVTLARVRDHLAIYQSRNMTVVLALGRVPAADSDVESWRQFIQAVAERSRGKVGGYQIGEVQAGAVPDVNRYVYLLKLAAVQIRSADSDALILEGSIPPIRTGRFDRRSSRWRRWSDVRSRRRRCCSGRSNCPPIRRPRRSGRSMPCCSGSARAFT
jgi:hypothetical protein